MPSTFPRPLGAACLAGALTLAIAAGASALELTALSTPQGLERARAATPGDTLTLTGLALGADELSSLELRRVQIFTPGATLFVDIDGENRALTAPDIAWYTGRIVGVPGSRAALGVRATGEVRGLISKPGGHWMLGRARGAALSSHVQVRQIDQMSEVQTPGGHDCGSNELTLPDGTLPPSALHANLIESLEAKVRDARKMAKAGGNPTYTARIAVETDIQFLDKFGDDANAALAYLGDIFAYVTGIFEDEIDTSLAITHSQFWATTDPWTQGNPACALLEFGRYWNDNNGSIDRTIAHFFSGRNNGGGIAWVGVLCSGAFNYQASLLGCSLTPDNDNYGGGYGYTGDMDANFDLDNPSFVWDVYGWNHEVGHNFNSPHTHCYNGVGGSSNPVDTCESGECSLGCYCGSEALPCGTSGGGCGTIMSYCHLRSGGLANISPTFGAGHPWGDTPDRVPTRMGAHVVSRANSNPGCLDFFQADLIFGDGFESGNISAWDSEFP
ncbi:MAG: M12 family metallo-peptidase [Acidobacteriota bacterium]